MGARCPACNSGISREGPRGRPKPPHALPDYRHPWDGAPRERRLSRGCRGSPRDEKSDGGGVSPRTPKRVSRPRLPRAGSLAGEATPWKALESRPLPGLLSSASRGRPSDCRMVFAADGTTRVAHTRRLRCRSHATWLSRATTSASASGDSTLGGRLPAVHSRRSTSGSPYAPRRRPAGMAGVEGREGNGADTFEADGGDEALDAGTRDVASRARRPL